MSFNLRGCCLEDIKETTRFSQGQHTVKEDFSPLIHTVLVTVQILQCMVSTTPGGIDFKNHTVTNKSSPRVFDQGKLIFPIFIWIHDYSTQFISEFYLFSYLFPIPIYSYF